MDRIRLSSQDISAIQEVFKSLFSSEDHLWVFGSRVNPSARGGDIDLYIEVQDWVASEVVEKKMRFVILLQDRIGDQRIDVVVNKAGQSSLPIHAIAKIQGILLI